MYQEVTVAYKSSSWKPTSTFRERLSVAHQGGIGADGKNLTAGPNAGLFEHAEGESSTAHEKVSESSV